MAHKYGSTMTVEHAKRAIRDHVTKSNPGRHGKFTSSKWRGRFIFSFLVSLSEVQMLTQYEVTLKIKTNTYLVHCMVEENAVFIMKMYNRNNYIIF